MSNGVEGKRDWRSVNDRCDGRDDFVAELVTRPEIRSACLASSQKARKYFAEFGRFDLEEDVAAGTPTAIPQDVEFRIYEQSDLEARKKLVTIVLPTSEMPAEHLDQVWRCTYDPYREDQNGAG